MMTTSGDTSFSSPSSDVAPKNAPKFSLENYEKLLSDFLHCSNTYQQQASNRSQLEQTCAQLFPKIWTMTDQQRNILVPDQSVQPPQSISLAYKFQMMQFSEAAFGEFCGVSNHVVDCMSGPYLNSYYQQLTSQQTLLYYVLDHLCSTGDDDDDASDKKDDDNIYEQLLRVTMRSIQMERAQQQQQMRTNNGLTVLQELAIFICKLWMTSIEKQRTTGSSMNGTSRQQHQPEEETLFMDDIRPALLDTLVEQQLDDDDFLLMDNEVQPIPLQRTTSTAGPKREMARGLLVNQLLPLILEYDAIDYLHVVLQPTTQQVVEEKLFEVLLTEQNVNRLSGAQVIKIMNQFPVHDLSRCYSENDENDVVQVKESILDPLKNALNLIASVQNHNLLLLSHVAKLILFFVSEFPSLALDGLMALTRAKWPSKMVAHTVLTLFPWDKLPEDIQDACVTEMYNVYCRTIDSLADNEQVAHLNDYCNKFLIPYASIVQSVYQVDSVIASMNKNVEYPIFVAFRKLAETAFSNSHYSIGDLIVSILFGFCFKSGTTISSHLVSLGKIRVESSNELASLCIHSSYAFSNVLNDIVKSLGMLLQTQPLITDQICALIQKSVSRNYLLNDGAIVSMRGLLSSVRSPTFITEPSIRIFKTIVENVPWKKQSQTHVLDVLDLILYNSTINPDIRQWAVRLLSGPVGGCMTSVSQVSLAEEFIIKHNSTNDEVVTALCLLISLGVCSFKLEQSKLYDEQYQLWQQCVSELRILEMLENANDSPFLVTIIQKYVGCLAAFFGNDAQKFIPVAAHTLSKYLRDLNNIPAVLSLISACAVSNSTKEIEIWSLLLLETLFSGSNCSIVLDQMIKYHYCHKLDMTPIIESVKSKQSSNMNPSLTINNLIHANQYWTAYTYLSALEVQMPPVIDRASDDGELVGSVQLSTDIDCAMWISVECAFKAAQRNSHIISLIFWQYFFNLYFQLEERYGSNIFPRYLMDRYNNQISNQLSAIPPDHPASSVLRTLYTWDRTKCGSGHCLDDSLLVILDNNSARPATFNVQPSPNAMYNQPPPSTRLPPVPSHMVGSMSASNYMTNSMTNSYISPPVSPPLSQIQQVGVLKPMDMSLTRINTPMVNVQVQQSEETEITKASMLVAQPLPIPTNSLVKDRTRYDSIKKMMHSVLHQSTDSELLLELPDDMTGEHGSVSDDHSVKFCAFVKRLLSNYVSALKKWSELTSEYLAYTKATYVNAPGTTIATATSARGITIPVSVPISTIQLVEPDVVNKMNNNRHAGSTLQKTLHEITENLSLIGTVVHQLSVVLENDSSKQHLGRVIVFELLSDMLDMNTAQKLGAIWSYYAKNLAAIGRSCVTKVPDVQQPLLDLLISAPALPTTTLPVMVVQPKRDFQQQIVSAIANVVNPVINALQPRPSVTTYSLPPNYAQTTQQSLRPTTPMQPIQSPQPPNYQVSHQRMNQSHVGNAGLNSERMLLFSMFEPNILLRCGRREEFALLMSIVAETDTKLSLEEVGYLCSRFDLVEFFRELETYPEGKRFTSRDDIKLLLKTLKSALCKPHLQKMFGNKLLRNCARLAFPYETVSFLRMILTLCRSGEYTGNDWPDLLVSQEEMSKVSIELCITWINIINEYQPLSGVCAEGCLNFVYRIVTQTALASYMDRCDIHADAVNSIVNFFEAFVSTRTDKLQDSLFQQMLSMLFAVIKSCPAFVDRLWTLYNGSLYPYVATAPPASITALTTFMKNVNWSTSVFHINNMEVLDELFHALIQNVEVASHVISQLNWNFVMRSETTSPVICKVARLYIALEFFNISSILPPHIRAFFEKLDQYEVPTPVWQRITPSDFAAAFSDRLLFKLLVSSKLPTDPSDAYMKIVYWMTEISLSLNHAATAEAIASEVRSTMFTVLKSAGQDRTWYLTSKQLSNVLMHCLIPLAIKFASNTLIMYVLSTLRECEKGVTSIVIPQNMPFAIGDCPFDSSSSAMRSEKHQALLEKFKNIIIHFATSANEKLAHTILGCILMLDLHLDTQVIVLEYTVRSLLKLSTSQHPRHAAANALQLPPHMILYSSSFNLLLERCIDTYSALALAVLIHKLLDVTLQVSGNNSEAVTNGYIYAMDYILKFVPHPSREDFDIIYVYFLALEMIDSQYWDLNNSFVRERVQKFDDVLTCLSQKYAKTLTQRLTTTNNSQKLKECKISPATCLAARAVRVYMEEITRSKQLTTQPHVQARSSMYANLTGNYGSNNYFPNMLKLKERKEFASFELFFDRCGALLQHIDHEQFRELISLLFPLVPYMHRV